MPKLPSGKYMCHARYPNMTFVQFLNFYEVVFLMLLNQKITVLNCTFLKVTVLVWHQTRYIRYNSFLCLENIDITCLVL